MTGGTIDAHWDGSKDTAIINGKSVLPDYFSSLILYADVEFTEICMKDSREISPEELDKIIDAIEKGDIKRIIITHGTYTMPDSARYIAANLKSKDKIIVLTGSMVPLKGFEGVSSDAGFNLGFAYSQAQILSPGVYLAMNGRIFNADEAVKDLSRGKFYSVFDRK